MCLPSKNGMKTTWPKSTGQWLSGCASVTRLGGLSPFQSWRTCSPRPTRKWPGLPCGRRDAAASATRRRIHRVELFAGFRPQVRFQQRSEPCDKHKLTKKSSVHSASSAWRQSGGCRSWRIPIVGKRGQMPTLPGGAARASDSRPQQRPAS